MEARETLAGIRDRLSAGEKPQEVIESLLPRSPVEAEPWARRLPLWIELAGEYGEQPVAVARVVSKRGMRQHRLELTGDGRVMARPTRPHTPGRPHTFQADIDGVPVRVVYTPGYFRDAHDHFQFTGPGDPPEPFALTPSGHYRYFAPSDAVAGLGGPEAFVQAFVAAGPDRDRVFRSTFEGDFPAVTKPVKGKHTAKAVEQPRSASPKAPPPDEEGGTPGLF